jgi:hypothetical protein
LRDRIVQRQASGLDASEADLAALERLEQLVEPLDSEEQGRAISLDTAAAT